MKPGYLILQNGSVYKGFRFGAEKSSVGELVFTTGMCGYIETLTDPSYAGQTVLQTFPMIGNYGIIPEDFEGKSALNGYVVREYCDFPSNFRSRYTLDEYLKENGIPGLYGVDTRQITREIRDAGVMNAAITDVPPEGKNDSIFAALASYRVSDVLPAVTCKEKYVAKIIDDPTAAENSNPLIRHRVALLDYGLKQNIVGELTRRGCEVNVFPADTNASEIIDGGFDGVMLSNGPGDPEDDTFQIAQIGKLLGKLPVFGICLGHQLTALAAGGSTYKLKFGHRGVNQPVKSLKCGRTYITSQNHGYAVDPESVAGKGTLSFVNANDGTCEGIDYPSLSAFTVQFHPEARSGPHDTSFLFDRFIRMMEGGEA